MGKRPDYSGSDVPSIARRVKLTRQALGLSQAEMCRRTGITPPAWNNYEKALGRPDLDPAFAIVRATGVTLDWLYFGTEAHLPASVVEGLRRIEDEAAANPGKPRRKRAVSG